MSVTIRAAVLGDEQCLAVLNGFVCEIDQIAVAPGSRRKGIGSALIQQALTAATEDGFGQVELCTWSFNVEEQVSAVGAEE